MSYVGKIISDIIQTTSDIIFAVANTCKTTTCKGSANSVQNIANQPLKSKTQKRRREKHIPAAIHYICVCKLQSLTFFFFIFDSFPMRLSDVTTYVYLSTPLSYGSLQNVSDVMSIMWDASSVSSGSPAAKRYIT